MRRDRREDLRLLDPSCAGALTVHQHRHEDGLGATRRHRSAAGLRDVHEIADQRRSECDPRVERGVQDVGQQVDDHDHDREDEGHGLDDREVALQDRVDHELADARQGVDLLDDERAADEEADADGEHGDRRDDRVAEAVADEHPPLGQPLRARGRDVVGLEDLEQARTQAADEDRDQSERHRQRR